MSVALTAATFDSTVAENDIVLVDWWALLVRAPAGALHPSSTQRRRTIRTSCSARSTRSPRTHSQDRHGISSIPTLMIFREGVLLFSQPGALPAAALDALIEQVRGLDMDVVREDMAKAS